MQERNCLRTLGGEEGCPKCCEGKNPSSCFISGLSRSPLERDIGVALEFQPLPFFFWSCLRDRHDTLYQVDIEFGPLASLLSSPSSVRSPLTVSAKGQRMKEGKKEMGREEGRRRWIALPPAERSERGKAAKEIKSALEIVFLPSIRNLSDHPPLALTKDWTSEEEGSLEGSLTDSRGDQGRVSWRGGCMRQALCCEGCWEDLGEDLA